MKINLLSLSLSLFFLCSLNLSFAADDGLSSEDSRRSITVEIRELIRKLGDENFVIRERASKRLLQIGVVAEHELRRATKSNDVEISLRASSILSQMEQYLRDSQNESVETFFKIYSIETDQTIRLTCIWGLASPLPDYCENGEGLFSLCRIVRFGKDKIMRNEAAKCLIAFAPFGLSMREKWYANMRRIFGQNEDDVVFNLIHDYVLLRTDIDELRNRTEKEVEDRASKSGEAVDYPVKLPKSKELEERLKKFVIDLGKFQKDASYSVIKPGHWVDILVFYAIAEMYDELGMVGERDEVLENILTIREKPNNNNPTVVMNEFDNQKMNEHFRTAVILRSKQRIIWAERHLKLVIDESDSLLIKLVACLEASMIRHIMADLSGAVEYLRKNAEIVKSDEFKKSFGDSDERLKKIETQISAYRAQIAADNDDWKEAKELVDKTLVMDPNEVDTIILRFRICERIQDMMYKSIMRNVIQNATQKIRNDMMRMTQNNVGGLLPHVACNQAAWLLANTDGEFSVARDLIEIAVKREPDSSTYLDTQAHVFALGKQFDKAIEIQTKTIKLSPEAKIYRKALERFKKLKEEAK